MGSTNLNFVRVKTKYEASFTATKNFNLHVEGGDNVKVYQKTAGTKGCLVGDSVGAGDCYDFDFGNYVYPKEVTVVCDKEPSCGYVTTED